MRLFCSLWLSAVRYIPGETLSKSQGRLWDINSVLCRTDCMMYILGQCWCGNHSSFWQLHFEMVPHKWRKWNFVEYIEYTSRPLIIDEAVLIMWRDYNLRLLSLTNTLHQTSPLAVDLIGSSLGSCHKSSCTVELQTKMSDSVSTSLEAHIHHSGN